MNEVGPVRDRGEISDELRQSLLVDIGKYALIDMSLTDRIRERKPGFIRSVGRFIFHHPTWKDDQYWIARFQHDRVKVQSLARDARSVIKEQDGISYGYYRIMRDDVSWIDLIRSDALKGRNIPAEWLEATAFDTSMSLEP